jgi:hypothetical protein
MRTPRSPESSATAAASAPASESDIDHPGTVLPLARRLVNVATPLTDKKPELVAGLIAALAVVRDQPQDPRINEAVARTSTPEDVLKHFLTARRLATDVTITAPRLLIHVVDVIAAPDELAWANQRYGGQNNLAPRYSEVPYDNTSLSTGQPVRAMREPGGYSLQANLRGGVCAHQTYFSATVGKAIGIPTVSLVAVGTDMAHAWLGFLRLSGQRGWDMDTGRFGEYEKTRGLFTDPQTGRQASEGRAGMTGTLVGLAPANRRLSEALALAARADIFTTAVKPDDPTLDAAEGRLRQPRFSSIAGRSARAGGGGNLEPIDISLSMLDEALKIHPQNLAAWDVFTELAPALSSNHRQRWGERAGKAAATNPDFAVDLFTAMIRGMRNPDEAYRVYDALYNSYRSQHKDLAAEIRVLQAELLDAHNRPDMAYSLLQEVIQRNINDGPAARRALTVSERILRARLKRDDVPTLWGDAFKRVQRPSGGSPESLAGSTWAFVGRRYAAVLQEVGRVDEAAKVRESLANVLTSRRRP